MQVPQKLFVTLSTVRFENFVCLLQRIYAQTVLEIWKGSLILFKNEVRCTK